MPVVAKILPWMEPFLLNLQLQLQLQLHLQHQFQHQHQHQHQHQPSQANLLTPPPTMILLKLQIITKILQRIQARAMTTNPLPIFPVSELEPPTIGTTHCSNRNFAPLTTSSLVSRFLAMNLVAKRRTPMPRKEITTSNKMKMATGAFVSQKVTKKMLTAMIFIGC